MPFLLRRPPHPASPRCKSSLFSNIASSQRPLHASMAALYATTWENSWCSCKPKNAKEIWWIVCVWIHRKFIETSYVLKDLNEHPAVEQCWTCHCKPPSSLPWFIRNDEFKQLHHGSLALIFHFLSLSVLGRDVHLQLLLQHVLQ